MLRVPLRKFGCCNECHGRQTHYSAQQPLHQTTCDQPFRHMRLRADVVIHTPAKSHRERPFLTVSPEATIGAIAAKTHFAPPCCHPPKKAYPRPRILPYTVRLNGIPSMDWKQVIGRNREALAVVVVGLVAMMGPTAASKPFKTFQICCKPKGNNWSQGAVFTRCGSALAIAP